MPSVITPAKRTFGSTLARLHKRSGLVGGEVAKVLGCDPSTITRYLKGRTLPQQADLQTLLNLYDATPADRTEVADLGRMGRAQLDHLATLAARPNIVVQVVPFAIGIYGTMTGPMTRFGYPGKGDDAAVYLEYPGGGAWVRGEEVRRHELLFTEVVRVALSPADTMSMIDKAVRWT